MLIHSRRFCSFWFLVLIAASCISESDRVITKITYSDNELSNIKEHLLVLEDVFSKLRDSLPSSPLGYVLFDSTIRYRHCFDSLGNDIDTNDCNLSALLNDIEHAKLLRAIAYLKVEKISGSIFSSSLDSHLLILDVNYKQFGDNRYLFLTRENDLKISKAPYEILDRKNNFYLLKDKL